MGRTMKKRFTEARIVCFLREADAGLPVKEPVPSEGLSGLCGLSAGNGGQGPTALLAFRAIAGNVVSVSYRFQRTWTEFESHPFAIHTSSVTASAAERSIRYS